MAIEEATGCAVEGGWRSHKHTTWLTDRYGNLLGRTSAGPDGVVGLRAAFDYGCFDSPVQATPE